MTVSDYIDKIKGRANEAVPGRFITEAEHIDFLNETVEWLVETTEFNKSSKVYSFSEAITGMSSPLWFDLPTGVMRIDTNAGVMFGSTYGIRAFNDGLQNWYQRQERPQGRVYVTEETVADGDSYIQTDVEYPQGNRKYFVQHGNEDRLAAGKSGDIISFNPDITSGTLFVVGYIKEVAEYVSTGETVTIPRIYHRSMMDYEISIIKAKAGDIETADWYERRAQRRALQAKDKKNPTKNKKRRFLSPQQGQRRYRHPWRTNG